MQTQIDLFSDTQNTPVATPSTAVVTPKKVDDNQVIFTPRPRGVSVLFATSEPSDEMDIWTFASAAKSRIWPKGEKHRERSLAQLEKFVSFSDYSTKPLHSYKSSHVHQFIDYLEELGASDATLNRYAATVSKIFRYANRIRVTDFTVAVVFKSEDGNERPRSFTDEEVDRLLAYFKDNGKQYIHDMTLLSLRTGMRMGEILALGKGDIYISNCGDWIELPGPFVKNKTGRSVPLANDEVKEAAKRLADTLTADYNQKTFYRWWWKAKQIIGNGDKTFTFHVCRHTCLTNMSEKLNANAFTIAKLAGHKSLKTTNRYVHTRDEAMLEMARQMAKQ